MRLESLNAKARFAGFMYLLLMLSAPWSLLLLPSRFIVAGNAAATAQRILADPFTYRVLLFTDLITSITFIFLAWAMYTLFKDVNRKQAMLMVMMVIASATFSLAALVSLSAPLVFLSDTNFLAAFTKPQLDALAFGSIRLHTISIYIVYSFWGLWLFPLGILAMKSGFVPKILGWLLIVAGIAELIVCVVGMLYPDYAHLAFKWTTPFDAVGEIGFMLWLLVMGAKERPNAGGLPQRADVR